MGEAGLAASRREPPWGVLVVVAAAVAYLPALRLGFVWDDVAVLLESEKLRHWSSLVEVFRRPAMWVRDLPAGQVGTYRPLSLASFVVDQHLYGGRAAGFHATSVLLHAAAQGLVFRLFRALGAPPRRACLLALVGALHPAAVEAVGWINGRSEIFALLFGTAALLAARPGTIANRLPRAALVGLCLCLAALGKETGAVFWALALALPFVVPRAPDAEAPRVDRAVLAGGAIGLVAYATARAYALRGSALPGGTTWLPVLRALPAFWIRAIQAALVPLDRAPTTVGLWLRHLAFTEWVAYVAATAGLLLCARLLWRRRNREALFGLAWWGVALAPAALVVTSDWPGLARWLYAPLPGLVLAIDAALVRPLGARAERAIGAAALAMGLLLTERALPVWHDGVSLFSTMVEESPDDPFGYQALGAALLRDGKVPEATGAFEEAVRRGSHGNGLLSHLALGRAYVGRCDEARSLYRSLSQPVIPPEEYFPVEGRCFLRAGRLAEARGAYQKCATLSPLCQRAVARLAAGADDERGPQTPPPP